MTFNSWGMPITTWCDESWASTTRTENNIPAEFGEKAYYPYPTSRDNSDKEIQGSL